jgi:hypothetical protein
VQVGYNLAWLDLDGASVTTFGLASAISYRVQRWWLQAEMDFGSVQGAGTAHVGVASRLGLTLQFDFFAAASHKGSGRYWVEAGLGRERWILDSGLRQTRPDLIAGGGWHIRIRASQTVAIGAFVSGRYVVAREQRASIVEGTAADAGCGCAPREVDYTHGGALRGGISISW